MGGGEWALGTGPGAHGHPHGSLLYPPKPEFAESKPAIKLEHVPPKGQDGRARGEHVVPAVGAGVALHMLSQGPKPRAS